MKSNSNEDIKAFVNDALRVGFERQRYEHPKWYYNLAMYIGLQNVFWNEFESQITKRPRSSDRDAQRIHNLIKPLIVRTASTLLQSLPRPSAIPRNSNAGAYLSARAWRSWFDYIWSQEDLQRLLRDNVTLWALVTGQGYMRVSWDANKGDKRQIQMPIEPMEGSEDDKDQDILEALFPEAGDETESVDVPEGFFNFTTPSPFNILVDPNASRFRDAAWLIEYNWVPRKQIEEQYCVDLTGGTALPLSNSATKVFSKYVRDGVYFPYIDSVARNLTMAPSNLQDASKYVGKTGLYETSSGSDVVQVIEMWVAPNKEQEEGRYVCMCCDQILEDKPNPYSQIPYIRFFWEERLDSLYCDSLVGELTDLQIDYNFFYNKFRQAIAVAAPRLFLPDTAMIDENQITDEIGSSFLYRIMPGQAAPSFQTPNVNIQQYLSAMDLTHTRMQDIASLHSSSLGTSGSNVRSESMIKALIESDAQGKKIISERYRDSLKDLGRLIMDITRRYVSETRLIRVIGNNGAAQVIEFTRQDIESAYDVEIISEETLPKDRASRAEYAANLIKAGIFNMNDFEQRAFVLKMIEYGDENALVDRDETNEINRIQEEGIRMLQGEVIEVESFDSHLEHALRHVKTMREPTSRTLFERSPEIKQILQEHLDKHLAVLEAQAGQPGPIGSYSGMPAESAPPQQLLNIMQQGGQSMPNPSNSGGKEYGSLGSYTTGGRATGAAPTPPGRPGRQPTPIEQAQGQPGTL